MHATTHLPAQFAWSPEQIADAVPRRLSELSAAIFAPIGAANDTRRRARRASFLTLPAPALFRVRG